MILRTLAAVLLLEGILIMGLDLTARATGLHDADRWWRAAQANELEWHTCVKKHETLKRQIKREGLWRRMGMDQQPWLQ